MWTRIQHQTNKYVNEIVVVGDRKPKSPTSGSFVYFLSCLKPVPIFCCDLVPPFCFLLLLFYVLKVKRIQKILKSCFELTFKQWGLWEKSRIMTLTAKSSSRSGDRRSGIITWLRKDGVFSFLSSLLMVFNWPDRSAKLSSTEGLKNNKPLSQ